MINDENSYPFFLFIDICNDSIITDSKFKLDFAT